MHSRAIELALLVVVAVGCTSSHPVVGASADASVPRDSGDDARGTTVLIQSSRDRSSPFVGASFEIDGVRASMLDDGTARIILPFASRTSSFMVRVTRAGVTATLAANVEASSGVETRLAAGETVRSASFWLVRGRDGVCELWWETSHLWSGWASTGDYAGLDHSDCHPFD